MAGFGWLRGLEDGSRGWKEGMKGGKERGREVGGFQDWKGRRGKGGRKEGGGQGDFGFEKNG